MANTKVTSAVIADGAITPSKIASGDFNFSDNLGVGTSSPVNLSGQTSLTINGSVARVDLQVSQTTTASVISESGYVHLQPASGGKAIIGNGATDLVVDSSGNVGIGTSTAPAVNGGGLAIYKSDYPRITLRNSTSGDTTGDGFQAALVGSDMQWDLAESGSQKFFTGGTERLRITSDGKISINEGTPTAKLHVYDANFTGYMLNLTNGGTGGGNHGFLMECASTSAYLGIWKTQGTTRFYVDGSGTMYNDSRQGLMGVAASGDIACRSGTSTPSTKNWRWGGNIGNDVGYFINNNNAGVAMSYGSTAWSAHSDERVKENIVSLGEVLPEIQNIRCVKYNRIGDDSNTKIGFIAQDWQSTSFAEVVDNDTGFVVEEDGRVVSAMESESTEYTKMIAYTETIPVLLKAIQEQQTIIDDLKARIETLENA